MPLDNYVWHVVVYNNIKRADMKAHFNAGVSESVASRAGLNPSAMPEPPKPTPPNAPPRLRVIDGGRSGRSETQRDARKPIENVPDGVSRKGTSD